MKISTRKYLEDIRKAEVRGYRRGRKEALDQAWNAERRTDDMKRVDSIESQLEELKVRIEKMIEEKIKAAHAENMRCRKAPEGVGVHLIHYAGKLGDAVKPKDEPKDTEPKEEKDATDKATDEA